MLISTDRIPPSTLLPKCPTYLLKEELEKNVPANNDFKNLSVKNCRMKECTKTTKLKCYIKELQCLKRKTSALKTLLKTNKRNDKCSDEWKTGKTKLKNNTKHPLIQCYQKILVVIEIKQIEIHKSQDHTLNNHHKRFEITISKTK